MNKDRLIGFILGALACAIIAVLYCCLTDKPVSVTGRSLKIDTVKFLHPMPRDSVVVRYKTVKIPVASPAASPAGHSHDATDTACTSILTPDSAEVAIPITQKIYGDSTYRAYVSGYDVSLDSIAIYNKTVTIRERELITKQPPRLGWGIICGAGYGRQGVSPYIGIGVYYRIGK